MVRAEKGQVRKRVRVVEGERRIGSSQTMMYTRNGVPRGIWMGGGRAHNQQQPCPRPFYTRLWPAVVNEREQDDPEKDNGPMAT